MTNSWAEEEHSRQDLAVFTDWLVDVANLPAGRHDLAELWERFQHYRSTELKPEQTRA